MALIQCPECQRQVSDQATACPGCARPINNPSSSPFGGLQPAITVRPDFWHDPNVGAVAALIAFVVIVCVGVVFTIAFR